MLTCGFEERSLSLLEIQGNVKGGTFPANIILTIICLQYWYFYLGYEFVMRIG